MQTVAPSLAGTATADAIMHLPSPMATMTLAARVTALPTMTPALPQTRTATPRPATALPGTVLDFERWSAWKRGDQPYGSLTPVTTMVHSGNFSGRLSYDFPAVKDNYVVFWATPAIPLPGQPTGLSAWVYGDGSGNFLNVWIQDAAGEVRQYTFGQVSHHGWQQMTARFDDTSPWPTAHISGPDDGKLSYPVRLSALVLDGVPDGQASSGVIYLDDVTAVGPGNSASGGNSGGG
jgi:hypothetical protein